MINSLSEFIHEASKLQKRVRINCVQPHDRKTMEAIESVASSSHNLEFTLFGRLEEINEAASERFLNMTRVVEGESEEENASNAVTALEGDIPAVLMKGDINTTVFLRALFKSGRVKASGRLISHISCMEIPEYPRLLFITDGTVNIAPDLKDKVEILKNAVEFARSIGINEPKVAIIGINERVSVTNRDLVEGAVLSKMAERGQFGKCLADGPMPIDTALKKDAALKKGITSKVGGEADILVCSNLESAANLIKGLVHLGKAKTAGLLLGAGFPVVLTSRSDNEFAKEVSLSMALVSAAS